MKEIQLLPTTWIEMESIMLSGVSCVQKDRCYVLSYVESKLGKLIKGQVDGDYHRLGCQTDGEITRNGSWLTWEE